MEPQVLSASEKSLIGEYQQAIRDMERRMEGALTMIIRMRGLQGNWTLQGDQLVEAK
jgi:hypothetical protein